MFFGLHVSIAKGIFNAPINAAKIGCETFQMFTRSPHGGPAPKLTPQIVRQFKDNCQKFGYSQYYIHTPYYINLASSNSRIANDSIRVIREDLERGWILGATALMTHLGSAKDLTRRQAIKQVISSLKKVLTGYKGSTQFLIEMSAGAGNIIGDTFKEITQIIHKLSAIPARRSIGEGGSYKQTGVCFDTAHAFQSGYDLKTPQAIKKTISQFDKIIGLEKLKLIHINDSKTELGSHIDRHWHIGKGKIGLLGFKALISHPSLKNVNMILETPGPHGGFWDKKNLKTLKSLRDEKIYYKKSE